MTRAVAKWQKTVNRVLARLRKNAATVLRYINPEAQKAVLNLLAIKRVKVTDRLGEAAFRLDQNTRTLELGSSGLDRIWAIGEKNGFGELEVEVFCEIAVSLYLYHEMHHVAQRMVDFADVQILKQTAGPDKLGELDVIADVVAAQIFATGYAAAFGNDRKVYATAFFRALHFMIEYCFPAFGFPLEKKHKVQRALGIVLTAVLTERAIRADALEEGFDTPLYPAFSDDYTQMAILSYSGNPSVSVLQFATNLHPDSVKEMLELIDSDNVAQILQRARQLV